ncbi:elongation factor P maturation arginine rhamnosyltransferase EarP [Simiduia sp. 21SJ11W-1]|uniref:elongation factor P maturation arginine rhamnosyltransferase EarP n=1 Tax=Simiduia sp. 21SJ11W-1 TaxID=2909669 RepID=UPI0020A21E7D|nr:elongation factor P maturation arginine rhamnosyltransferase EarP [Simiduia sp. 21SJ11W-1]UTA48585.1 elongation factor P maturation arginine rhamnosyltransferase EarP [Simiduia sp. 21SJ11W-1]
MNTPKCWHIFCRVIDNFGDIGVCWRLARQLAHQHECVVCLFVDDLASFQALCKAINPALGLQTVEGIEVRHWCDPLPDCAPADVVIEAFGCDLPTPYIQAMKSHKPHWLNLEYLSAEAWVKDYHLSKSPVHGLKKTFFFPGFEAGTGGLLCEPALAGLATADDHTRAQWRQQLGLPGVDGPTLSLFSYENPALPALLDSLAASPVPCVLAVPRGRMEAGVNAWLGEPLAVGQKLARGQLTLVGLPFLQQPEYDRLLALCDLNFVRGEDSFVRTQMLGRPFVWHIYPQEAAAHLDKLAAFLSLYTRAAPAALAHTLTQAHAVWNQPERPATPPWPALLAALPALSEQAQCWREEMLGHGNLASNIVHFCTNEV